MQFKKERIVFRSISKKKKILTEVSTHFKIKMIKMKVKEKEKNMKKILKTVIASLSVLLLSACSFFDKTPKDWTKGYLDENAGREIYVSEVSPLLKMEDTNKLHEDKFSYVTFQGKATMLAAGGPNIMVKFESLWQTEVKDVISEILINRWYEDFFSLEENYYIPNEYALDLRLNGLFFSIFLYNTQGEGQYFNRFIVIFLS